MLEGEVMTNRDTQLKSYREYQEALQDAQSKKPQGLWYKVPASDGTEEARAIYDPADDSLELSMTGNTFKIPGKYLKSFQAALNSLVGESQ
jgi:hypothetical protein